jgi:hypothetical protein
VRVQALITETESEYGLARISHRTKGATTYIYDESAGANTTVYVVDSGIYTSHSVSIFCLVSGCLLESAKMGLYETSFLHSY